MALELGETHIVRFVETDDVIFDDKLRQVFDIMGLSQFLHFTNYTY